MKKNISLSIFLLLFIVGCTREKADALQEVFAEPKVEKQVPQQNVTKREPQIVVSDVPLLAHGNHFTFGLRMPKGMMPMTAPSKEIHRFESTHSITRVKKYILEQLHKPVKIKKNSVSEGFFISAATPASRSSEGKTASKLNIKIFESSLGGAGVEIWKAKENQVLAGGGVQQNPPYNFRYKNRFGKKRSKTPVKEYKTPQEKTKATFAVIEKLSKGKTLTEQDYASPYFTNQ